MNQQAKAIIAGLGALVVVLAIALVVVMQNPGLPMLGRSGAGMGSGMGMNGSYRGMMQAMGGMDSDAMLARMREVLSPEDYQRMVQHMASHRAGGAMPMDPQVDGMMHRMMDGMFQQMPDDRGRMMPFGSATPAASATPVR